MKIFLLAVLAGLPIGCSETHQNPLIEIKTDLTPLQGYWEGEGPGGICSVNIVGESLFFYRDKNFWFDTKFTLPDDTDPPQLHATILKDNTGEDKIVGEVVPALYKIEGKQLILVTYGDQGPPDSIDAESGVSSRYDLLRQEPREGRTHPPMIEHKKSSTTQRKRPPLDETNP